MSQRTLPRSCVCRECGKGFFDGGRGRRNLTCPGCLEFAKMARCRGCDGPVPMTWRGGPKAGWVRSGYYCSDDCKPRCSVTGCDEPLRKRGWCANHYAVWRYADDPQAARQRRREYYYTVGRGREWAGPKPDDRRGPCMTCGTEDLAHWEIASRKFCSGRCQVTWHKYGGSVPESFDCAVCGITVPYFDPVTRKRLRSDSAYCSAHVRHARVYVTVEQLAAEDGTDCRLCGEPVDMALKSPDRLSPSIDHIVPRAHGGSDYRENLQLTHRGCNSSKRHRLEPEM